MSTAGYPGRSSGTTTTTTTTTTMPRPSPASTGGSAGVQQQRPGRLRTCMARIPLCTTSITILCLVLQLCVSLRNWDIGRFSISPAAVLEDHEYIRILTSPYFHVNLLHIAMNMLSFIGIGGYLEFQQGTLFIFTTIAYGTVITNLAYLGICELLFAATKNAHWYYYSSVGFSGIIFQLAVLETYTAPPGSTRSIFGVCNVPAKLYPWALLVIIQIVMPRISFVGHLAGLLVGILQAYGCLGFLFPPRAWVNRLESSPGCSPLVRCGQYIPAPEASDRDRNALCAALGSCCGGGGGGGGGSGGGSSPGRRTRGPQNFGGGTTGFSSSPPRHPPAHQVQQPWGAPPSATVVATAGAVPVASAVGGAESPHTRAAGADGRGWQRLEEGDDLEGGAVYYQQREGGSGGQAQWQHQQQQEKRQIVL